MRIKNFLFLFCIYFSSHVFAHSKPISLEISRVGNHALTKSLQDALRLNVSHSRDFVIGTASRSDLKLLIADETKVNKIANHTQVSYKVSLISKDNIIGVSLAICWQDQITECVEKVLRDAKITIGSQS